MEQFWTPAERKGFKGKKRAGYVVTEDEADEEKQTVHGRPPPHASRYPAAQRLQESAGARLGLQACSSSCILFLKAAPDKTALFIAPSAFALCLSKARPCLPVTKLSCKQVKQIVLAHTSCLEIQWEKKFKKIKQQLKMTFSCCRQSTCHDAMICGSQGHGWVGDECRTRLANHTSL